ncbi:transposase [Staphylococcus aureus]|uniref:transposase n=1 Tax=Staphylococcus aureus TaxID=1280 RepID=UPI003F7E325D
MSSDTNSLAHTKWNCKYHIVFAPKYRRQVIYGKIKKVEFLFEILYVGAPPIIEKCLLHGHFHSVNYYQYNIVEPKTLIYYVLGSIPSFNDSIILAILYCPMISVLLMRHNNYKV